MKTLTLGGHYPFTWIDLIYSIGTPLATLGIGIFTIYTTFKTFSRTMLDNLDSKSGWRKTLYNIAGTSNITMNEVYQLRASVRFKKSNKTNNETSFSGVSDKIIEFCDDLANRYKNQLKILTFNEQEMTRIFCRYLLANQWEILQLSSLEQYFIKKRRRQSGKIKEELINKKYSWHQKTIYCIFYFCNKNKINSRIDYWIEKEDELIEYTLRKYEELKSN